MTGEANLPLECEYINECKNNDKCLRCHNYSLKKIPKRHTVRISRKSAVITNKDKPWETLEKNIVNMLNKKARRTRASGCLPFEKGDVMDDLVYVECKSRSGRIIQKGADKSFTISKLWIEKAQRESQEVKKPMVIPFQFASDFSCPEKIYAVMNVQDVIDLVSALKSLKAELNEKEQIINKLKR
jgi:hypothetical protein